MKKIALLAGSFDPPTFAHQNLIQKAQKLCDHLIVVLAINPAKKSLFPKEKKLEMLQKIAKGCEVIAWEGLLVDLAEKKKASFLIQGLQADLLEKQRAQANFVLKGIETVFLLVDPQYSHISSSLVREIALFKGDLQNFVPKEIEAMVKDFS